MDARTQAELDARIERLRNEPVNCGRISSHVNWYKGKWERDTCHCGHRFSVPKGSKGKYRCNCCADAAEFGY